MRTLAKLLSLAILAGASWMMGGCSSGYVRYSAYDDGPYYGRPAGYYYYRHHRPYYYRDRYHRDNVTIRGNLSVRDW